MDSRSFEVVMQQAISGQLVDLETALTAANNGLQDVTSLAALLSSLRPTGRLEWAWFSEKQLDTREDVLFFKDTNHQTWSLTQDAASGKVVFHPLKSAWFEKWLHKNLLESTVKKLEQS